MIVHPAKERPRRVFQLLLLLIGDVTIAARGRGEG